MACFRYEAWIEFTGEKKVEFKRVLVDSGQRHPPKTVQSTGGGIRVLQTDHQPDDDYPTPMTMQSTINSLDVLNISTVARKPSIVRQPRSTSTTATTTKRAHDKTTVKIKIEPDSDS